jgi:phosphate starvation-inducible protein PhoH
MKPKKDTSERIQQRDKIKNTFDLKPLAWTDRQKEFLKLALDKSTRIIFVNGPAGSTKTIMAVFAALELLNQRRVSDIIYLRSAVESSSESLGFLPGSVDEKMMNYGYPLMEKLEELLTKPEIKALLADERVHLRPLNYIRGQSWNARVAIADECLTGDSQIVLENGTKTISNLKKDHNLGKQLPLVKTFNETTRQFEFKKIKNIICNGRRETVIIRAGNRKIQCTDNHKFLTSKGWVEARNLQKGDILLANDEHRHQVLNALNDDQKQVFLGSFLGDGGVSNHGINRNRLRIIHGIKQQEYCQWKASMFGSSTSIIEKNGYSQKPAIKFATKCFAFDQKDFAHHKKSHCPQWVLDELDWRGIGIWFMDDGSIFAGKNGAKIYTCSFSEESQQKFVEKFENLGIKCKYHLDLYPKRGKACFSLVFDKENTIKLLDKISPYIHESMDYKNINSHTKYKWNNIFLPYNHVIFDSISPASVENVFDLEVEDNHNFIIASKTRGMLKNNSGVIVHNCQNMTKDEIFTIMTRVGKFSKLFILADPRQSDLKDSKKRGGFTKLAKHFTQEKGRAGGIHYFEFTRADIMRDDLTKLLVELMEDLDAQEK